MRALFAIVLTALTAVPCLTLAQSANLDGTRIALDDMVSGLDQPVFATAPKGDARLYIVEQSGAISILEDGIMLPQPLVDMAGDIRFGGEQGLLGLAFHPDFASNGRFFTASTHETGDLQITEHRAVDAGTRSDPGAARVILTVQHRKANNHNGGWLDFGPDGYLYIGTGDGGGAGDKANNAQNPEQLLGKILRIDVDSAAPYAIPPANPFAKGGGAPEIFALGLRNPWRAAFDGKDLYIADVGQNIWEEINVITTANAGANLGWRLMEGQSCFRSDACDPAALTLPVHVYDHDSGCSVTGGFVYRGAALPALQGRYLFSDYCSGALMSFRLKDGQAQDFVDLTETLGSLGQVTSFGQDAAGELYIMTIDGTLSKLIPAP